MGGCGAKKRMGKMSGYERVRCQRVKQKHQKTAYNAHMVSAGVSMMKENNVRQALTYDDGSVAE